MLNVYRQWLTAAVIMIATGHALAWNPPALVSPAAVRLGNPWNVALKRGATRLNEAPLDRPDFILDDVTLRTPCRLFTQYSGDLSGRWIDDAAWLTPQFPKEFELFSTLMTELPSFQKPDGHFGTNQDLSNIERGRDMPILWGNGRMLTGLAEVYEHTTNAAALRMAKKLGDYFVATDSIFDQAENIQKIGGSYADGFETCYFSCIEGLAALARVSNSRSYLEQAERMADLALTVSNFDGLHCHGRITTTRGIADLYALTRDQHWLQGAERDWKILEGRYLLPTGGFKEVLDLKCNRDEGCAEADWLRLNLSLWRVTGDGRYLDAAEYCLHNHFIYQQFPDGGSGHRFLSQINGQPVAFNGLSQEAWWCCCEHWPRAIVDVARSAVVADDAHIFVNLDIDCDSTVSGPRGLWKVNVRKTKEGLKIRLTPTIPGAAEVCIHHPDWAHNARIEVPNGFAIQDKDDEWVVAGVWRGSQNIYVRLAPSLRMKATGGDSGVFMWGYDLLAAAPSPINNWLTENLPSTRPTVLWSEKTLQSANGTFVLSASLSSNAEPDQPDQWHRLKLSPLRAQAGDPQHKIAWFSFQPRRVNADGIRALAQ